MKAEAQDEECTYAVSRHRFMAKIMSLLTTLLVLIGGGEPQIVAWVDRKLTS